MLNGIVVGVSKSYTRAVPVGLLVKGNCGSIEVLSLLEFVVGPGPITHGAISVS